MEGDFFLIKNQMEELIKLFKSIGNLSGEDELLLGEKWIHERTLMRGEALIDIGSKNSHMYFVKNGSMRIFYPNDGNEICVGFSYSNTLLVSFETYLRDMPSHYCVEALKKTELIYIKREDFNNLRTLSNNINQAWYLAIEQALIGKIERETEILTFSPSERVERLLRRSPHIFQIFPKKYIASYLGMTAETLSRIPLNLDLNQE